MSGVQRLEEPQRHTAARQTKKATRPFEETDRREMEETSLYDSFSLYGSGVTLITTNDGGIDRFFVAASVLTASVNPFTVAVSVGLLVVLLSAAVLAVLRWSFGRAHDAD